MLTVRRRTLRRLAAVAAGLMATAALATSCGSSNDTKAGAGAGTVTVGSFGFSESVLLADIYAGALRSAGFTVTVKANLGSREIVQPALQRGEIDIVPEYVGNALAILFPDAAAPGDDVATATGKLRDRLTAKGVTVLDPSDATDGDAIGVTKATAARLHLTKISDLAAVGSQLVLGGPPECATRITCQLGLQQVYGITFKSFKSLDAGGPLTKAALDHGDIDVARLFTADSSLPAKGYVILDDDKHIQPAGNIVPMVRTAKVTAALRAALDKVSKRLTTDDLIAMNKQLDVDKADAADVAATWLKDHDLR